MIKAMISKNTHEILKSLQQDLYQERSPGVYTIKSIVKILDDILSDPAFTDKQERHPPAQKRNSPMQEK